MRLDTVADAAGSRGLPNATMGIEQVAGADGGDFVEMGPQVIEAVYDLAQKLRLLRDGNVGGSKLYLTFLTLFYS